jgi:hypothetical protein
MSEEQELKLIEAEFAALEQRQSGRPPISRQEQTDLDREIAASLEETGSIQEPVERQFLTIEEQFEYDFKNLTREVYQNGKLLPQEASHRMSEKAIAEAQPEASRLWKEKLKNDFMRTGEMPNEQVRIEHARNAINEAEDTLTYREAPEMGQEMVDLRTRPAPEPPPARTPARPTEPEPIEIGSLDARNHITRFNAEYEGIVETVYEHGFKTPDIPESIRAKGDLAIKKYIAKKAIEFMHEPGKPGLRKMQVVRGERTPTEIIISQERAQKNLDLLYDRAQSQQASSSRPAPRPPTPPRPRPPTQEPLETNEPIIPTKKPRKPRLKKEKIQEVVKDAIDKYFLVNKTNNSQTKGLFFRIIIFASLTF